MPSIASRSLIAVTNSSHGLIDSVQRAATSLPYSANTLDAAHHALVRAGPMHQHCSIVRWSRLPSLAPFTGIPRRVLAGVPCRHFVHSLGDLSQVQVIVGHPRSQKVAGAKGAEFWMLVGPVPVPAIERAQPCDRFDSERYKPRHDFAQLPLVVLPLDGPALGIDRRPCFTGVA